MKHTKPAGRFPDLRNTEKPRWRDALTSLIAPATRLHRLKELQVAAVEEFMDDMDCRRHT